MSTASVTTDINIGPYKIPSNAQNMIMNNFAERNGLKIEFVIPEPIMSNQLGTTQWLYKDFKTCKEDAGIECMNNIYYDLRQG